LEKLPFAVEHVKQIWEIGNPAIMWKWLLLFVNGCEWDFDFYLDRFFLNYCHDDTNASLICRNKRATFKVLTTFHLHFLNH
jgi:hypothetical protein